MHGLVCSQAGTAACGVLVGRCLSHHMPPVPSILSKEADADTMQRCSHRMGLGQPPKQSLVLGRLSAAGGAFPVSQPIDASSYLQPGFKPASKLTRLGAQAGEGPGTPQGAAGTPRGGGVKRTASLVKPSGPDAALVGPPTPYRLLWISPPGVGLCNGLQAARDMMGCAFLRQAVLEVLRRPCAVHPATCCDLAGVHPLEIACKGTHGPCHAGLPLLAQKQSSVHACRSTLLLLGQSRIP